MHLYTEAHIFVNLSYLKFKMSLKELFKVWNSFGVKGVENDPK